MKILLDTNILARSIQPDSPQHPVVISAIRRFRERGDDLFLVPQNLFEFWVVCTRPRAENGLGMTPAEAFAELTEARSLFPVLGNDEGILLEEWESLVRTHEVRGKRAHDARLVAAMRLHGLTHILTLNTSDFQSFAEITTWSPADFSGKT